MKSLKLNNNEELITIICSTLNGVEWIIVKKNNSDFKIIDKGESIIDHIDEIYGIIPYENLPAKLKDSLQGNIYFSLPSKIILSKVDTLPSIDLDEINEMSKIQMDKINPFPSDKIIYSNEIINKEKNSSSVLMMSTQKKFVDLIDDYTKKDMFIKKIDSRILAWLDLINKNNKSPTENEIIILSDDIDLTIITKINNLLEVIRPIYINIDSKEAIKELLYELTYTIQNKEKLFEKISIWSYKKFPDEFINKIKSSLNISVNQLDLVKIEPLSNGILERIITQKKTINFLPDYITQKQNQKIIIKRLKKNIRFMLIIISSFLIIFQGVISIRSYNLKKVTNNFKKIEIEANNAKQNYSKLQALRSYTDRSKSSIECLREITLLLPAGDIEFASFNYNKYKGISIRGTAINDDIIYEYFKNLGNSKMFNKLKNQSISTRISNGKKRTVFSLSLELDSKGSNEDK